MALITYFKAPATCPYCGHAGTAWIPSHLGSLGATYAVGDCPQGDVPAVDFDDSSYLVRRPADGEATHVLLSWTCEECKLETFAEVVLADGCVRDIRSVELDPDTLARLHYIGEDVQDMIETIIEGSVHDDVGVRADLVATLRAALERGRRWGMP